MEAAPKLEPGVGFTVTFTRRLAAPRELVFELWTDPAHLAKWWGPNGFTNPVYEFEARPGGRLHIDMTAPDGTVYPMDGVVEDTLPPERLGVRCPCRCDESDTPGVARVPTGTFPPGPQGPRQER